MFGAQPKINSNLPHDKLFVVKIKTVNYHILVKVSWSGVSRQSAMNQSEFSITGDRCS